MWPRLRPNSRTRPYSRSRSVAGEAGGHSLRCPPQRILTLFPRRLFSNDRFRRWPRHSQGHKRSGRSAFFIRPLHRSLILFFFGRELLPAQLQRVCPVRPKELRMFARSRFSRRFISVRNVLRILAFKSSVRCKPLVATRANRSPLSVINRIISRCRSCGAFPSAVSRLISAQLPSIDSVKCKTQTCCCSARAGGESFLHPVTLHGIAMGRAIWG